MYKRYIGRMPKRNVTAAIRRYLLEQTKTKSYERITYYSKRLER